MPLLGISFRLPSCCNRLVIKLEVHNPASGSEDCSRRLATRAVYLEAESEFADKGIEELSVHAAGFEQKVVEFREELTDIETMWNSSKSQVQASLDKIRTERKQFEDELKELLHHHQHALPPPKCLHFVEGISFSALGGAVIVANIVIIFLEYMNKSYRDNHYLLDKWLNNLFLTFYFVEFALKACLWKRNLLLGKMSTALWNWLDLLILVPGIVELWICPLLESMDMMPGNIEKLHWAQALRGLRLLRIIKLVHVFFDSDLSWVMGDKFQAVMIAVIGANSLLIALECDFESFWAWVWVEQVLLVIFTFELSVRLRYLGLAFFVDANDFVWNWLDFVIVSGGILDQWTLPAFRFINAAIHDEQESKQDDHMAQIMIMLRLLRLLRILRLVRLIRRIPPLYRLFTAMIMAMQGVGWVLCLALMVLYIFALLAVRLVSQGIVFGGEAPADVAAIFPNVPEAIFILFRVMNGEAGIIRPLFEALPYSEVFFVLFTIVSSWAILSSLTAVISESMLKAADEYREEVSKEEKEEFVRNQRKLLEEIFDKNDVNGDKVLEEGEYLKMLEEHLEELKRATMLQPDELRDLFKHLSRYHDDNERVKLCISRTDFLSGFQNESRSLNSRALMRLEKRVNDLEDVLQSKLAEVFTVEPFETEHTDNHVFSIPRRLSELSASLTQRSSRKWGTHGAPADTEEEPEVQKAKHCCLQ